MSFDGWPPAMTHFYAELEVNNTKEFWQANKTTYDESVRAPMEALVAELEEEFGTAKVFRPYRDVRFSTDKTPYKTEVSAVFMTGDTPAMSTSGLYVRANADGLGAGGGCYQMASDQLARFRAAVEQQSLADELRGLINDLEDAGFTVNSTTLKTAPRGWSKDHPQIDLLRRKDITFMREAHVDTQPDLVHTARAKDFVAETFRRGQPLVAWLDTHVGPTTKPRR
ncbi:DUF2461 domain-containing protein [Euzebya tangerina]|uniref:DUF2461 domain-containing protein n=1 Tax=Euzebya tangerina TaxID=591198 RepID=UPI000E31CEB9|nr:DUF2461 domain-containing protein [Euzebya tangerina]